MAETATLVRAVGPVEVVPSTEVLARSQVWLDARRRGVSASEIAAVLGLSPWESPFSIFWRKVHGWQVEETEVMRTGQRLEYVIADWWAAEHDPLENLTIAPAGLYASAERPWQLATPDRLVYAVCADCSELPWPGCISCGWTGRASALLSLVECKWVAHSWDGWGDPDTEQIPVYYRAQCQQQMDVMNVDEVQVAALGPGGFRHYRVRRDDKDIRLLREAGRRFMDRIAVGEPPSVDDHAATLTTLKRLHPDVDARDEEVPAGVAAGYRRAVAMGRKAEVLKRRYETLLRSAMGDAHRATCDGRRIATRVVTDVAERTQTVAAHRRDYLLPSKEPKP